MTGKTRDGGGKSASALLPVLMFLLASLSPMLVGVPNEGHLEAFHTPQHIGEDDYWSGLEQPWGQFARTPTHNATMPSHGPDGGPGEGYVNETTMLGTIENPGVNWVALDGTNGADTYGSIIGDFSASITAPEAAQERCADEDLFAVLVLSLIHI